MLLFFGQDPYLDRLSLYRKTDCKYFLDAPYNNKINVQFYFTSSISLQTNLCEIFPTEMSSSQKFIKSLPRRKFHLQDNHATSPHFYFLMIFESSLNQLKQNSHFTCNLHVFSFPFITVYSPSKDLLRSKIIQQLKIYKL